MDARTTGDLAKLVVFVVVTTLATATLAVTIGNLTFGDKDSYRAVFTDATGLAEGDDVRIAGVRVGTVTDIELDDDANALVRFSVEAGTPLDEATNATIRYRNLVGQRYIALTPGDAPAEPLTEDTTIPLDRTHPALDLTVLFNGFKPLFTALSPEDVNELSFEIIQVFQGEGGTVESLLSSTASVTTTIADRDKVVGALVTNLNDVLATLGERDDELSDLIATLQTFVSGLEDDRRAIFGSLDDISDLAVQTSDLVSDARPLLARDITRLRRVAAVLDDNRAEIDRALQILPVKLEKIGRTASYGSWFNFYLCNFTGRVKVPGPGGGTYLPVDLATGSARCELG
jgi:phospholipid/cholesterol/gamma-HCH transport system substrate-binding protein